MKVLMVGPARSVHGGISAVVNGYYEAGLDKRAELKYIGTMKEGSRVYKLLVAVFAYLRFAFIVGGYDIVHVHVASDNSFWRKSFFIRLAKKHGKKLVLHQHGGDIENYYNNILDDKGRAKVKKILDMADVILVLSERLKDFFESITDSDKISVLPNGVKIPGYNRGEHSPYKLLFLGRICADKGINELIDAVSALRSEYPGLKLYFGGIYEDSLLKSKVEANSEFIEYLGWVSGALKEKYLRECGILVLPSYYEGFPVSVTEAMAYGCAVVASGVGAVPEIITDEKSGILVKPRSTESLMNGLRRVLENDELFENIRKKANSEIKSKYDMDGCVERLIEIYRQLIDK